MFPLIKQAQLVENCSYEEMEVVQRMHSLLMILLSSCFNVSRTPTSSSELNVTPLFSFYLFIYLFTFFPFRFKYRLNCDIHKYQLHNRSGYLASLALMVIPSIPPATFCLNYDFFSNLSLII